MRKEGHFARKGKVFKRERAISGSDGDLSISGSDAKDQWSNSNSVSRFLLCQDVLYYLGYFMSFIIKHFLCYLI